jgi:hypothetical protein
MKIEIELTEDYVRQLKGAGFTEEQILEYTKETAKSWIQDMELFNENMEELIENMEEYYGK